ncbi:MAG: prephenate dehydratase [Rickettsiales bacterium]|nr:prephenate dehydratase [Rickettsiales bacterium]
MKKKIAYQGRPGAYSHLACKEAFPDSLPISCETFEEVFEKTEQKESDLAFIPIENSQAGRVADIHNLLPKSNLLIAGEHFHKIKHQLLGLPGSQIEKIKSAESHFHALAQCRDFLTNNNIRPVLSSDTAGAAEEISKSSDLTRAAIASELAADIYGLKIIKKNIEDAHHNTTRFLLMKDTIDISQREDKKYITSFLFKLRNISSALYKALGGFSSNKVNMLKIESYMLDGSFTATQFYIDIEGHPEDDNVKSAIEELGFFSKEVKILGSYPANKFRNL